MGPKDGDPPSAAIELAGDVAIFPSNGSALKEHAARLQTELAKVRARLAELGGERVEKPLAGFIQHVGKYLRDDIIAEPMELPVGIPVLDGDALLVDLMEWVTLQFQDLQRAQAANQSRYSKEQREKGVEWMDIKKYPHAIEWSSKENRNITAVRNALERVEITTIKDLIEQASTQDGRRLDVVALATQLAPPPDGNGAHFGAVGMKGNPQFDRRRMEAFVKVLYAYRIITKQLQWVPPFGDLEA